MPSQPNEIPRLTRDLTSALDAAMARRLSSVTTLRDSVCAYYDALIADGQSREEVRQAILDLMVDVEPSLEGTTSKTRRQLFDNMIEWCEGARH
jgi:hypothetical protein